MKFAGKRPNQDRTTIIYNPSITITGIPIEVYDCVVMLLPPNDRTGSGGCLIRNELAG
jgi:hypothetical protein